MFIKTSMLKNYLILYRPQQWMKNLFIFIPIFFAGELTNGYALFCTTLTFFSYCCAASSIYCFNDIFDVEKDRQHPKKSKRPIASGELTKRDGYIAMFLALFFSLSIVGLIYINFGLNISLMVALIILIYYVLNVAYCIKLKHYAIVDVFIIAIGFILRVLVGGLAAGVILSQWLVLMTFLLALFLAFAKRRDDVLIYEGTGFKARPNINRYNVTFMDQSISIIASITMVCYIMYTVSEDVTMRFNTQFMYLSSIFVLAGLMRYLQLTIVDKKVGVQQKFYSRIILFTAV